MRVGRRRHHGRRHRQRTKHRFKALIHKLRRIRLGTNCCFLITKVLAGFIGLQALNHSLLARGDPSMLAQGFVCIQWGLRLCKREPLQALSEKCMQLVDRLQWCKCNLGVMNAYGSEGPIAHERRYIKRAKKHGLVVMYLNKSSIISPMEYLKQSSADIAFIQELNQKQDKFNKTRSLLKKGLPSFGNNDHRGVEDAPDHIDKWKCEGSPSVEP